MIIILFLSAISDLHFIIIVLHILTQMEVSYIYNLFSFTNEISVYNPIFYVCIPPEQETCMPDIL